MSGYLSRARLKSASRPIASKLVRAAIPKPIVPVPVVHDFLFVETLYDKRLLPDKYATVMDHCAAHFNVTRAEMVSASRKPPTFKARAAFCFIFFKCTKLSQSELGRMLGGRDHTTILHAIRMAEKRDEIKLAAQSIMRLINEDCL